jgi:2-polyprenyl-3-methyl-5-hydroxy-6-metoxy-1,4-benzoquinol methylase
METHIINKAYFDNMYALARDPWNFETSIYEQEKYAHTIVALGDRQFEKGLEIGCSIGVLTGLLAKQCASVLGVDISEQPVKVAKDRYKDQSGINFQVCQIPQQFPEGLYDLIVLSEVCYYLSKEDLILSKELILDSLTTGGTLCMVHWRPQITDCVFNGDEVNDYFLEGNNYTQTYQYITEKYRIDVIVKH